MPDFDVAVIGAGAAGLSVAAVAAQLGLRVALIERNRMGGDCLDCRLRAEQGPARRRPRRRAARRSDGFGLRLPEPDIDWAALCSGTSRV